MENEEVDQEEVWSAIRYLDPDEQNRDREARNAAIATVLTLLLTICALWLVIWLRVQEL